MHRRHNNRISKFVALAATAMIAVAMMAFGAPSASAVTHAVQVPAGQNLFTPQNLGTITVGDTITWKNNDVHNVVSAAIPAGATPFASPIMAGPAATFSITVTVPGNYRYLCTLHSSVASANAPTQSTTQMVGQFTVVAAPASVPTPTVVPTVVPTVAPTVTPTMPPMTMPPTVDPTVVPTVDPTVVPTVDPTVLPTVAPAATPRTVQVPAGQNLFTPQDLGTINVGDTITWKNNEVHNVVSANIPAGATAFESPIMAGPAATFSVTVTTPGNYRYLCTLHSSAAAANAATQDPTQMVGQFTVAAAPSAPAPTSPAVPTVVPTVPATVVPTVVPTVASTMPPMPSMPPTVIPTVVPTVAPPVVPAAPPVAATPRTVQIPAGKNLFTPQDLGTINVGDTITWKNNDVHNVVSANIPAGATAFESPIMSGPAATFSVTVTSPGNYRYLCTLHSSVAAANAATQDPTQMVGQFTVVGTAIPAIPAIPAGTSAAGTTSADTSAAGSAAEGSQVGSTPIGGVQAGGGSTAGFSPSGMMTIGGGLLIAAFMSSMRSRRLARQE